MESYLIELKRETITSITVQAGNVNEAIEKALRNEGRRGDSYLGETTIINIQVVDNH